MSLHGFGAFLLMLPVLIALLILAVKLWDDFVMWWINTERKYLVRTLGIIGYYLVAFTLYVFF